MLNPYANRAAIRRTEDFFGRRRELREIYGLIVHGQPVSLVGERRVGKSSLMRALGFEEIRALFGVPEEVRLVLIDGEYFTQATEEEFLKFLLEQISEETGAPLLEPRRESLRLVVRGLVERSEPQHLVILLDEVDVLINNPEIPANFFSFLRAWTEQFRIPFVIASREGSIAPLVEKEGAGSPFWNIFKPVYVGPFSDGESRELIHTPAERLGQRFTDRETDEILSLGGRQPFFLQIACYHMFELKASGNRQEEKFVRLRGDFYRDALPHLEYLLRRLPAQEAEGLAAYIRASSMPDQRIQAELTRKGVLIQDQAGLRIFSAALQDLIVSRETEGAPKASLLQRLFSG